MTRKQKRNVRRKPTPKYIKKALDGDDELLYEMYPALAPPPGLSFDEMLKKYFNPIIERQFIAGSALWKHLEGGDL